MEYDVRVIASTDDTESAPSKEASATPEETAPATPNSPATGQPTISGTVQVGEELTADTSGIADSDGLANAEFSYQWLVDDTAIEGATASGYTLTDGEKGKAVRVRVSFTDDAGHAETRTSAATETVTAKPNRPATGQPTINGTAQVGETLMADVSGISDADGKPSDAQDFAYQWVRVDGQSETDIPNAVAPAYHPTTDDVGKTIEVNVRFTDDAGHSEGPRVSAVTDSVEDSDTVQVPWGASLTAAAETVDPADLESGDPANIGFGDPSTYPGSSLVPATFAVGSTSYTFREIAVETSNLEIHISPQISAAEVANWRFLVGATEFTAGTLVNEPDLDYSVLRWDEADLDWNAGDRIALAIRVVNTPATGAPSVTGTVQMGETLTADDSGITDADGKPSDAQDFAYQWVRVDGTTATDIAGAKDSSYTLVAADAGKTIKVTVSFTDLAGFSEGPLTSAATAAVAVAAKPNSAATGQPTISGTAQVGETLTAATAEIADADGLANASFSYQWLADDTAIEGATDATYTLAAADEGKSVRVRVSFTDDAGHAETLISAATAAVTSTPNSPATGAPTISGTVQVGAELTASTADIADADGLANASFSYQWLADDTAIEGATDATYTLAAADEGKAVRVRVSFTDDVGHAEALTSAATTAVAAKPNSAATGAPTISGTAQVGAELTASTADIADADGLANATFSYQWLADDTAIEGATGARYTLTDDEEGKAIKVQVSFTDDAGHKETVTSAATAAVAAKPNSAATGQPTISGTVQVGETLTASTTDIADADGLANATFSYQWLADDTAIEGATGARHTLTDGEEGKAIKVRVSFTDDAGHKETVTSAATAAVAAKPNSAATGQPTISGTGQVGEELTVDTSDIADANGLDNATFSYQWLADDTAIEGATDATYTLAAADEGKAVRVRVSFTDDVGHAEALTSAATTAVAAKPNSAATGAPTISGTAQVGAELTASTADIADADGLANATFSYQWLADDTAIEGATGARYTLTDDEEGKAIKVQVSFTDDAGHKETVTSAATAAVAAKPNSAATGQPTISGTAQVGETLTASTMDIADADGLANATFSYQWLADDTAIEGATGARHTLTDGEEGKAIKVRVSFTDDAGHKETVTSAATAAVAAKPNSAATGQPTISGTAQVGEELRAATAEIADADGLANATFSYQWLADDTAIEGATGARYTLTDDEEGKAIKVQVSFTDDAGHKETVTSAATAAVAAKPNSAATGQPTISGTAQVGEELRAATAEIADADGLANASFSYQWLADDTAIEGATGARYTLTDGEEGKAIKVRVTFTDDAGHKETLTSAATAAAVQAG